jgi:hypothetical protein
VAPPGNQAANGENKPQPVISGETGLLDSINRLDPYRLTRWAVGLIQGEGWPVVVYVHPCEQEIKTFKGRISRSRQFLEKMRLCG